MVHGWISGQDPLTFNPNDIVFTSNGYAFQRIGQPKVVGELLAGIILGPTAFGNIPNFSNTIIPSNSIPLLTLTSNIGLILFILIVGLETDTETIIKNARKVALIALPGMAIPFAISIGLANFIYHHSTDQSQKFTTFFLFVATVMAVTSLSVLSRVVSEMQLVNTVLGSIVIAAGALNDLLGYILLALGSSLATKGRQINALYELLVALAMFLVQWFLIRPFMFWWIIKKSNFDLDKSSKQRVPPGLMAFTLVGAFVSAWITEACNLHPILGVLLFGIACPHGNFSEMVTDSIETVVQILLPLYFVTSGLKADFKLLNSGLIWGELFLTFAVVFISKYFTTALFSRVAGFGWNESFFVASLMQSKSIIELIILNAGQEAGVLNSQVYSMLFVTFIFSTLTVRPLSLYIWKKKIGNESKNGASIREGQDDIQRDPTNINEEKGDLLIESPKTKAQHFPIIAALTSINPAIEPLTALMQLTKRTSRSQSKDEFSFNIVRYLPNDNSTSNILRYLHQRGDEILDAVKMIATMEGISLNQKKHVAFPDLLTVGNDEEILNDLSNRTKTFSQERVDDEEGLDELGKSMIVASWDKNVNLTFLENDNEGKQMDKYNSMTNAASNYLYHADTMATRLFNSSIRNVSSGVLVEPGALLKGKRLPILHGSQQAQEELLGLRTQTSRARKARVIVPFFGGADDRACLQFAKRLASDKSRAIDVIVIRMELEETPNISANVMKELEGLIKEEGKGRQGLKQSSSSQAFPNQQSGHEDVNMLTVNLKTVDIPEEQYADARALFGASNVQAGPNVMETKEKEVSNQHDITEEEEEEGEDENSANEEDSPQNRMEKVYTQEGIVFVNLNVQDIQLTRTKTPLEAILNFAAILVNAQSGDMLIVGRGKWNQRRTDFRSQLTSLQKHQKQLFNENNQGGFNENDIKDLQRAGRILGACCEGVLSLGINANILVIQSPESRRPH